MGVGDERIERESDGKARLAKLWIFRKFATELALPFPSLDYKPSRPLLSELKETKASMP